MIDEDQVTYKDITTLLYVGPAILHVHEHYREELLQGILKDEHYPLFSILNQVDIIDNKGKLTPLGNQIFGSVDLIRYYMVTGMDMSIEKKPATFGWKYDLLRKGLGQFANIMGLDYIDFLNTYTRDRPSTVLDLGCGDGSYSMLVGERYEAQRVIMIDKDVDSVEEMMDEMYPNSIRYKCLERDISAPLDISPYKADLVLMNEVIHLKDEIWWSLLMSNALTCSTPSGQICIGEVQPEPAFDWRMKSYTDEGRSVSVEEFLHWIHHNYEGQFEEDVGVLTLSTHWFLMLTKRSH